MSQLRRNPLTRRWVTVALERSLRPADFAPRRLPVESDPSRPCPFCPGNEEATPPALETYGPSGTWMVRVVPNLYPAFEGDEPMVPESVGTHFAQAHGSGIHEVLVLSPEHARSWADLDDRACGLVMAAVRDRFEEHARTRSVQYTQAIVNHGREAGASLVHGHGQLLGIPFVPGEILDELAGFADHEGCVLCEAVDEEVAVGHRVVAADDRVAVVCPFWSGAPFEMLVVPRTHEAHLAGAAPSDLVAVSKALRGALARLRAVLGDVAYNLMFHTAPHRSDDDRFHWHVHVLPRTSSIAGFEQGTGVMINVMPPEMAAQQLRSAPPADG